MKLLTEFGVRKLRFDIEAKVRTELADLHSAKLKEEYARGYDQAIDDVTDILTPELEKPKKAPKRVSAKK